MVGVILGIALGPVIWLSLRPHEPVYDRRTLSQWLTEYDGYDANGVPRVHQGPDKDVRVLQADEAVRQIGTNAIPTLLRLISTHETLGDQALAWFARQRIVKVRHKGSYELIDEALSGFDALGSNGGPAVPALITIYHRTSPKAYTRQAVIESLGDIGPPASNAIPLLLSLATNRNEPLEEAAIEALGKIHSQPELIVPALAQLLASSDPLGPSSRPCIPAAIALGEFRTDARTAVPVLLRKLTNTDYVDPAISNALKAISPDDAARVGIK